MTDEWIVGPGNCEWNEGNRREGRSKRLLGDVELLDRLPGEFGSTEVTATTTTSVVLVHDEDGRLTSTQSWRRWVVEVRAP